MLGIFCFLLLPMAKISYAAVPPAPTSLVVQAASSRQINLTWFFANPVQNNVRYEIWRSTSGGAYVHIANQTIPAVQTFMDLSLTQQTQYCYYVKAYSPGPVYFGTSGPSNVTCASPPSLSAPTALSASFTSSSVNLSWTDNTSYETAYYVERSYTSSGGYSVIATLSANTTTYSDASITQTDEYVDYYYRVRAYDGINYSGYSNVQTVLIDYTIAASADTGGSISPSGTVLINSYSDQSFTITPNAGYAISDVLVDGRSVGAVTSYTFDNITECHTIQAQFVLDSTPPTGSISINNGAGYTNSRSVTLNLSATDTYGVSQMKFSNDNATWSEAVSYATSTTWTLSNGDGTKTVYAKFKDNPGNWTTTTINDTIVLDITTGPTGSIKINNDAASTNSTLVTLTLSATDVSGVNLMQFSNDGITWSTEESYATSKGWALASGDGSKTVYVKYKDNLGNESIYSDTITLAYAPTNLAATPVSVSQINLQWSDNSANETAFSIEYRIGSTGDYALLVNVESETTSYVVTGLTKNTTYYFKVRAIDANGYSLFSPEASATTPYVSAPSNFTATASSSSAVTLTWTDNSTDEIHFFIERAASATGTYTLIQCTNVNETTYTDNWLGHSTTYYYRIRAYNGPSSCGYYSASSYPQYYSAAAEASATTLVLNAPTNLTATAVSSSEIQLSWTDNSDELNFSIERSTSASGTYTLIKCTNDNFNETTYTDKWLGHSSTYYYRVRAYKGGSGSCGYSLSSYPQYYSAAAEASATTLVLNAPTNLTATAVSSSEIQLSWTDNSDELDFAIERATSPAGTYTLIKCTNDNLNETTYTDKWLGENTTYYYRVRAYKGGSGSCGYSLLSYPQYYSAAAEANAATYLLATPTNFTAMAVSSSEITLTWTDNSDELNFSIERSTSASGTYTLIKCTNANETTYTDSWLGHSSTYYYRVRAYKGGAGNCGYTPSSSYPQYYSAAAEASATTLVLNAPMNLTATAVSSSEITLTWTDNSDELDFAIERATSPAGTYTLIKCTTDYFNETTYTDKWLGHSSTYYYRVRAYKGGAGNCGYTPSSSYPQYYSAAAEASATTLVLNAPTNLTATAVSSSEIQLSWTDNSDELNFFIERATSATGPYSQIACVNPNVTTYTNSDLDQGTTYYYRVRAYKAGSGNCGYTPPSSYPQYYSAAAEVTRPIVGFSNVAASSNTLNTSTGEISTIFFNIDSPATVTLKIILETQGPDGTAVYQATQSCAAAGAYMFTWDGRDSTGTIVADDAYLYVLEAIEGNMAGRYAPNTPSGSGSISCSQNDSYNPFYSDPLSITYSVGQLSRINLSMSYSAWTGYTVPVLSAVPKTSGSHSYTWDGRYSSGTIAPPGGTVSCSISSLLSENVIITTGNAPSVSNLFVEPYAINVSFAEFTRIKYTLSGDAKVTITVTPPSGSSITVTSGETQTAGDHEVEWSALDQADSTGKKIIISQEGYYTVKVKAENPVTGKSSTGQASLRMIP
jgi:titin